MGEGSLYEPPLLLYEMDRKKTLLLFLSTNFVETFNHVN